MPQIAIRFEDNEHQKLMELGEKSGENISAVARHLINDIIALAGEKLLKKFEASGEKKPFDECLKETTEEIQTEKFHSAFQSVVGERFVQKFHAEAGDNLQEYLQKIILQQTNENAIIVDCPDDEIQKIDALRNEKTRPEYLRELIAKDQNEHSPPAVNGGFGEQIKTQILEIQGWIKTQAEELKGQTKTLHGTIEKDPKRC
jgi:hypothetical protein